MRALETAAHIKHSPPVKKKNEAFPPYKKKQGTHKSLSVPLLGLYQTAGGAEAGRIAVPY